MKILEARSAIKTYTIAERPVRVLAEVSFTARPGEFLIVNDSSGSGKSPLLSLLS